MIRPSLKMKKYLHKTLFLCTFGLIVSMGSAIDLLAQIVTVSSAIEWIRSDSSGYMNPKWSPDGSFIAYTSSKYQGLWVSEADGNDSRLITAEAAGFGFNWSPNADYILSRVSYVEGKKRTFVVHIFDIQGGNKPITERMDHMPSLPVWDLTGTHILLETRGEIQQLVSDIQPQIATKVLAPYSYMILENEIVKYDSETRIWEKISPFENEQYINLVPSPDGFKLAFEVYGGDLFILDIRTNETLELGSLHRASWAPDSQHLVAMSTKDDGYVFTESDLYVIDTESGTQQNITLDTDLIAVNPAWSPLNNGILFDSPSTGVIYLIPISYE